MVTMEINNQFHNQTTMSQFWHAHWAEDAFKPTRLQNWEVPRWHPEWPERHCATTKFEAHSNGRVYATFNKSDNPWGYYKGTWELPMKINRSTTDKLSKFTELRKGPWEALVKKYRRKCNKVYKESTKGVYKNEKDQSQNEKKKKKDSENKIEKMKYDIKREKNKMDKEFGKMCYVKEICTM